MKRKPAEERAFLRLRWARPSGEVMGSSKLFERLKRAVDLFKREHESDLRRTTPIPVPMARSYRIEPLPPKLTPTPMPARVPMPDRVYKYMKRKYAHSLIEVGNVRIGTLHGFRDVERFGAGIADPQEGKKAVVAHIDDRKFVGGTPQGEALKHLGISLGDGANIQILDSYFQTNVDHRDAYVWCCSSQKSAEAMEQIDGADTCVEIFDVGGFYEALSTAMTSHGQFDVFGPMRVIYHSLVEQWNDRDLGEHPMFMKGESFSAQHEVRVGWVPKEIRKAPLEHIDIVESAAGKFCRIIEI